MEDKNKSSTYKIFNTNEDARFCEQVEGNALSPTIDDTDRKESKSSKVSSCEQTESNAAKHLILITTSAFVIMLKEVRAQKSALVSKRKVMLRRMQSTMILKGLRVQKSALVSRRHVMALLPTVDDTGKGEVNSLEQVRTSSIVHNTEGRRRSEDLYDLHDGIRNLDRLLCIRKTYTKMDQIRFFRVFSILWVREWSRFVWPNSFELFVTGLQTDLVPKSVCSSDTNLQTDFARSATITTFGQ